MGKVTARMWNVEGWEDPWFERQDSAHKIAFMYLCLGPSARPSGLFVQSLRQMATALGTTEDRIEAVMASFEKDRKVLRDPDRGLVWVVNKARQTLLLGRQPGVLQSIDNDVQKHHRSPLAVAFAETYPDLVSVPLTTLGGGTGVAPPSHPCDTSVAHNHNQRPKTKDQQPRAKSTGKPAQTRKPDELWDALVDQLGLEAGGITKSRRGRLNAALAQLREVGATPAELIRRSKEYRRVHPEWEFTETALATHWASLARKKPVERIAEPADPEPPTMSAEQRKANIERLRSMTGIGKTIEEAA